MKLILSVVLGLVSFTMSAAVGPPPILRQSLTTNAEATAIGIITNNSPVIKTLMLEAQRADTQTNYATNVVASSIKDTNGNEMLTYMPTNGGTAGQVWTATGAGTKPAWSNAPVGLPANGTGMLTNNGAGVTGWMAIPGSSSSSATNDLFNTLLSRRVAIVQQSTGSSYSSFGDLATAVGTNSAVTPTSTDPSCINSITAPYSVGSNGVTGGAVWSFARPIKATFFVRLVETNAVRAWFVLTSGSQSALLASDNPTTDLMGFRFVSQGTTTNDVTWQCCTKDNSTLTNNASGVAANTTDYVKLSLVYVPSTSCTFYINGLPVATNTLHLPRTTSTGTVRLNSETLEDAAKNLRIVRYYVEETQ